MNIRARALETVNVHSCKQRNRTWISTLRDKEGFNAFVRNCIAHTQTTLKR